MSNRKNRTSNTPQNRQRKMKLFAWLLVAVGLLLISLPIALLARGSGGAASGSPASDGPQLSVDRETIDLGQVPLGKTVSASFTLTNTGSAPLRFSEQPWIEVRAGC